MASLFPVAWVFKIYTEAALARPFDGTLDYTEDPLDLWAEACFTFTF